MELSYRTAVSTYLEMFILIGIATAGSAIVYGVATQYESIAQGPSLGVTDALIRQGQSVAVLRMVIANTGTVGLPSFAISIVGIQPAQFYVYLADARSGSPITPSPSSGSSPSVIVEGVSIVQGQSLSVLVTFLSPTEFNVGSRYTLVVSSPAGAQLQTFVTAVAS